MPALTIEVDGPLDLLRTLAPLVRGNGDRTIRVGSDRAWWATRTASGPVTVAIRRPSVEVLEVEAWGPGADDGIARVPGLLGIGRPDLRLGSLDDIEDPRIAGLARAVTRASGSPRSAAVLDALVPAILEQKVTGVEARRAWQGLVRAHGEDAPAAGPGAPALRLPPAPDDARPHSPTTPTTRSASNDGGPTLVRAVAARADWFEAIVDLPLPRPRTPGSGPCRGSGRGRPPRSPSGRSATPMR